MADESSINAIVEHLLEGGIDTQLPAEMLDDAIELHVDHVLDERHQTAKLAFDPTKAQLIAALGDDLLVITENGAVILVKEFVLAVETGRLATVTTKEGYTYDAPEILTDYGFAEDFTDALLEIAPASGSSGEDNPNVESAVAESRFDDLTVEDLEPSVTGPPEALPREAGASTTPSGLAEAPASQYEAAPAAREVASRPAAPSALDASFPSPAEPPPGTNTDPPDAPVEPSDDGPMNVVADDPPDEPPDVVADEPPDEPPDVVADDPPEEPPDVVADDPPDGPAGDDTATPDEPRDGKENPSVPDAMPVEDRLAEAPTLTVTVEPGTEDTPLRLDIDSMLRDEDGSESLAITISGVPEGAALSAGSRDPATGEWALSPQDLPDLRFIPPENDSSDVTLYIVSTATESAGGDTASRAQEVVLTFAGVPDRPDLSVETGDPVLQSMTEFIDDAPFSWGVVIPVTIDGRLKDTDGSETLSIRIENLPEGAVLSTGEYETDGSVHLSAGDLDGLSIAVPFGTTRFDLTVTATVSEAGSDSTESVHRFLSIDPTNVSLPIVSFTNGDDTHDGSDDPVPLDVDALAGDDNIVGTDENDAIFGNAGNDTLSGGAGNDRLVGGTGSDLLDGGDGDDTLFGGDGDDTLIGGHGDDVLIGGAGRDTLLGGDGDDNIILSGLDGEDDFFDGGAGYDTLRFTGDGPHTLRAFSSQNGIEAVDGGGGTIEGTDANDVLDFSATEITNTRHIHGGAGVDRIYGSRSDDVIFGGSGRDILYGGDGDDYLDGGEGLDRIDGGRGNDIIVSGGGRSFLTGGEGGDIFVLGEGRDTILDFDADEGDRLDVSALVDIAEGDSIDRYLKLEEDGRGNTNVLVNSDGDGNSAGFQSAAFLVGATGLSIDSIIGVGSKDDTTTA